jgi:hypothetical protein
MSIENTLERIAAALELIAATGETLPKASAVTSASVSTSKSSAPAKPAKQAKPAKPASGPATTDSEHTTETIGPLVQKLLDANLRKEAVELMVKIGGKDAKSVTSLLASDGDIDLFVEEAEALLMAA